MSSKNLKSNNAIRVIFIIIAIAFCAVSVRLYISLAKTKMLPNKYMILVAVVEVVLAVLIFVGLAKKHKTIKINMICLVLAVLLAGVFTLGNYYVDTGMDFLGKTFVETKEIEEYYIIVRSNSPYVQIEDLNGKELYAFHVEDDIAHRIKNKILTGIVPQEDPVEMGNSLVNGKIEAVVISSEQYNLLAENIEDFKAKTKIVYTDEKEIEGQESITDENSNYQIGNGVFNIYVSGIDVYGKIAKVSRTDANVLVTVNMNTHEILLTSIPRDYYVTLHSKRAKDKLTHSGIYGINETVTTIEDLLDVDINYYLRVNFTTIIDLVDILDGINVYSDYEFTSRVFATSPITYHKGYNYLLGIQALAFCRDRDNFKEGDNQRVLNQQYVIEGIIEKLSSSTALLTRYSEILEALSDTFTTNISQEDIQKLVRSQLDTMPKWTVTSYALTGAGASKQTYSMGAQELYVTIPNQNSVNEAKAKINELMEKR